MKNKIVIFYVPCKNNKDAKALSKSAIHNKLSACANFFPMTSSYAWNDKIVEELETVLILKTIPSKSKKLHKFLIQAHSYECPCIMNYYAQVNNSYYKWMNEALKS